LRDSSDEAFVATFVEAFVGLAWFDKVCDQGCDKDLEGAG
jgi:hypothetical protein